jgi:hypothetical protein
MNRNLLVLIVVAACIGVGGPASSQDAPRIDGRDTLLAALGKATLDCLGTVEPSTYQTTSGFLARAFAACRSGDRASLQRIDALLAVQRSKPGRTDGLADHYVLRWNAFLKSFPSGHVTQCPVWTLEGILDAPTTESIPRYMREKRIGEENARYSVFSSQCSKDGECAVKAAVACAAGFGPGFVVDTDPRRSRVEVDPAWWLTTYEFEDEESNPFMTDGYYHGMSYYGTLPGALYGALERAWEACSQWDEIALVHFTDRVLVPIDCGGGWYCMTYCMLPVDAKPLR